LKHVLPGNLGFDLKLLELSFCHLSGEAIVWDVGANVGLLTFAVASKLKSARVTAIEPDPFLYGLLCKTANHRDYNQSDIRVLPIAVADKVGLATFNIAERGRASNSLSSAGRRMAGGCRRIITVPMMTLDFLYEQLNENPTFVKIDVEGSEIEVIHGAKNLISKVRPIFLVEISETTKTTVAKLFIESGYRIYNASKEINNGDKIVKKDILCLPEEYSPANLEIK
jgi:FkbM family methyltransferase